MALPDAAELLRDARVVALPLVARFRGIDVREAMLLRGPHGWAEFAPFPEYGDEESATWLAAAIEHGWREPPPPVRDRVPVNATMPAVGPARVPELLARFGPVRTVKVKVAERGQTLDDDAARVRAVRETLGPEGRIRLDANGAWGVDAAERAAETLAPFGIEYLEQPCATVAELAELRRRLRGSGILVAADESVRRAGDPLAVVRAGAADVVVVKAAPLGGVRAALRIVAQAGVPAVVSSALDTSVGLAMGTALAAALPELPYDCGLGTAALLAADVTRHPLVPDGGAVPVRRVDPDPDLLDRAAAPADRAAWWERRLRRCLDVLAGRGPGPQSPE